MNVVHNHNKVEEEVQQQERQQECIRSTSKLHHL
jgi:hypothetical protein